MNRQEFNRKVTRSLSTASGTVMWLEMDIDAPDHTLPKRELYRAYSAAREVVEDFHPIDDEDYITPPETGCTSSLVRLRGCVRLSLDELTTLEHEASKTASEALEKPAEVDISIANSTEVREEYPV